MGRCLHLLELLPSLLVAVRSFTESNASYAQQAFTEHQLGLFYHGGLIHRTTTWSQVFISRWGDSYKSTWFDCPHNHPMDLFYVLIYCVSSCGQVDPWEAGSQGFFSLCLHSQEQCCPWRLWGQYLLSEQTQGQWTLGEQAAQHRVVPPRLERVGVQLISHWLLTALSAGRRSQNRFKLHFRDLNPIIPSALS